MVLVNLHKNFLGEIFRIMPVEGIMQAEVIHRAGVVAVQLVEICCG